MANDNALSFPIGNKIQVFENGKPVSNPRMDSGTLSAAMLVQLAAQMGVMSEYYQDKRSLGITRSYPAIIVAIPTWFEFSMPVQGFSLINDGPNTLFICTNTVTPFPHQVFINEEHHIAIETHDILRVIMWCAIGNTANVRLETIE